MTAEHVVTVSITHYGPRWEFTCQAPADATCRLVASCQCPKFGEPGLDNQGHYHEVLLDPGDDSEPAKHYMAAGGACNARDFIDGDGVEDSGEIDGTGEQLFAAVPVDIRWNGDGYRWQVAQQSAVVGGEPR